MGKNICIKTAVEWGQYQFHSIMNSNQFWDLKGWSYPKMDTFTVSVLRPIWHCMVSLTITKIKKTKSLQHILDPVWRIGSAFTLSNDCYFNKGQLP